MPKSFKWFTNKRLLLKDKTMKNLSSNYIEKAKNNIITMELLSKATNFNDILELPGNYDSNEWVVISAYYSMYMAALGILAKLGYKSRNHSATSKALEEFFVKKKLLENEYLEILEKIKEEYGFNPKYDIEIYRDNIFLQIKPGAFNPQMIVFLEDNSPVKLQMDLIEKLSKELITKFQLEEKYKCLDLKYV